MQRELGGLGGLYVLPRGMTVTRKQYLAGIVMRIWYKYHVICLGLYPQKKETFIASILIQLDEIERNNISILLKL